MNKRIAVAMSAGVDSSTAAYLLKRAGYEIFGITMNFGSYLNNLEDAKKVAAQLKIRHYSVNMQKPLEEYVIKDFCCQYLQGRTPNPCIRCNKFIKFGFLLKKARELGADYLATGHYAKIVTLHASRFRRQKYLLKKAKDKTKDQSYFLYALSQNQLKQILFPLADYRKEEVKKMAHKFKLHAAKAKPSQEICFLSDANYRDFLKKHAAAPVEPGLIVDKQGNVLGKHQGISLYTIGQRQGLGIAKGIPLYIIKLLPGENLIVVGEKKDAFASSFLVKDVSFISELINPVRDRPPKATVRRLRHLVSNGVKKRVALRVRVRYNHDEAPAKIRPSGNGLEVIFKKPQFAITPGQSAVFYDRDTVVGGGIIEKVMD